MFVRFTSKLFRFRFKITLVIKENVRVAFLCVPSILVSMHSTITSPCNEDTPLLYRKMGVYRGINYFLIFALKD